MAGIHSFELAGTHLCAGIAGFGSELQPDEVKTEKGGISPHKATMPPQIHHITDVPTEHGILSASAASILAWLHPLSRLPGRIFLNTQRIQTGLFQ
jgi:hypothetical protein